MDDLDDLSDAQLIHSALQGDLELVTRYGEEHPATWAGVWFDNEPTVYLVAAFTSDVAQHDAALRPRLASTPAGSWCSGCRTRSRTSGRYDRRSSAPSSSEPR